MSGIRIIKEFQGASIGNFKFSDRALFIDYKREPLVFRDGLRHDYNWHFAFGLENNSNDEKKITIYINSDESDDFPERALIFSSRNLNADFTPANNIEAFYDGYRKYIIKIFLFPSEKIFISNTLFRSIVALNASLLRFEGDFFKEKYGISFDGRPLFAYKTYRKLSSKPLFLITSGFHPMEGDTYASEAVLEHICSDRKISGLFDFLVIPVVNPDGFAKGTNGSNARGINLYWDFFALPSDAPESYHLMNYLSQEKPNIYIDFHAYTFQAGRKKSSPYVKPNFFYSGNIIRRAANLINAKLTKYHDTIPYSSYVTYAPSTLSTYLLNEFNTLSYAKYHLDIYGGIEKMKKDAVNILKIFYEVFYKLKIERNSMMKRTVFRKILTASSIFYNYKFKKFLRKG